MNKKSNLEKRAAIIDNNLLRLISESLPGESIDISWIKYGRKLKINNLSYDAIDDMYEYSKNPNFFKNLGRNPHKNKIETKEYISELLKRIEKGYKGGPAMYWAINEKSNDKVIGTFGFFNISSHCRSAELGKGISPDYWGKGYVYELLGIMLFYAFETLKLKSLYSFTQSSNIANIKSMEKAGFRIVEIIDEYTDGVGYKSKYVKLVVKKNQANIKKCFKKAFLKYYENNI
jgi:ribosomal-protein-alanine N-acetyltransferase